MRYSLSWYPVLQDTLLPADTDKGVYIMNEKIRRIQDLKKEKNAVRKPDCVNPHQRRRVEETTAGVQTKPQLHCASLSG